MIKLEVANTILEKLGGNKFRAMTGAKSFLGGPDSLSFRIPGAGGFTKNGVNHCKVTLSPDDTYVMQFSRIRGTKVQTMEPITGLYFDQLQDIFESETGLRTSL